MSAELERDAKREEVGYDDADCSSGVLEFAD
jgi:hypothetical protein